MSATLSLAAIRVLATDSRPLMLRGIAAAIDSVHPFLEMVDTATDYGSAVGKAERLRPDVVLLGLFSDAIAPVEALHRLLERCQTKVLLLCDAQFVPMTAEQALQAGASGAVRTSDPIEGILGAILQTVRAERRPLSGWRAAPDGAGIVLRPLASLPAAATNNRIEGERPALRFRLTARELDVIRAIVANPSAKYLTIGAMLKMSEHTVHNHLTSIYQKLNVVNRSDLLHYAIRNQIAGSGSWQDR